LENLKDILVNGLGAIHQESSWGLGLYQLALESSQLKSKIDTLKAEIACVSIGVNNKDKKSNLIIGLLKDFTKEA